MAIRKFEKHRKDGTTYIRYGYDFYGDSGERYRTESCKTKGEAEAEYRKLVQKLSRNELSKENKALTFGQLAETFLNSHCKVHCSLATRNKYESMNKVHVKPYLGDRKLLNIKPVDINIFIAHLQNEKHLSEKSVNHVIGYTSTVFNFGINNDILNNNPCSKVKKLRLPYKEKNFLDSKQVKELLSTCKEHSPLFYPILYTAIFTGLRKGELSALTWHDIDFKAKKIHVNKSIYKNVLQKPKTSHSIRKVDMIDSLAQVLKEHRNNSVLGEYVFWGQNGTPLSGDATLWRHFNSIITKCGLKDITFHSCRHTFGALLIAKNVPIKYIQRQLGHSTIKMTMDTYGHLMPETHEQAVSVLDGIANEISETKASNIIILAS